MGMSSKDKRRRRKRLLEWYGPFCWWCKKLFPRMRLTIEHLIPRSKGGSHALPNLRLACSCCNNRRGDRFGPPPKIGG